MCDALRHHVGWLARVRGATAPSRNVLSHGSKHRDATMAGQLFWRVLEHLQSVQPAFGTARRFRGLTGRFKRIVHVPNYTAIQLKDNTHQKKARRKEHAFIGNCRRPIT